ncbi:MAG: hypothetical protein ACOCVZ_03325 [Gemmatimonadota bacterium]
MREVFGRMRLVGVGLLALAFLVGALTGAALDRVLTDGPKPHRGSGDDNRRSYIIDRVEMAPEQRQTIDEILDDRSQRMRAVWREVEPRLDAITDSARHEIMDVLTPEQRAEYERMLDRRGSKGDRDR